MCEYPHCSCTANVWSTIYRKTLIHNKFLGNANELLPCWKPTCVGCNKSKKRTKCPVHNTGKPGRNEIKLSRAQHVRRCFVRCGHQLLHDSHSSKQNGCRQSPMVEKKNEPKSFTRLANLAWVLTCSIMAASYSPLESYICSANVESRGSSWSG